MDNSIILVIIKLFFRIPTELKRIMLWVLTWDATCWTCWTILPKLLKDVKPKFEDIAKPFVINLTEFDNRWWDFYGTFVGIKLQHGWKSTHQISNLLFITFKADRRGRKFGIFDIGDPASPSSCGLSLPLSCDLPPVVGQPPPRQQPAAEPSDWENCAQKACNGKFNIFSRL